MPGQPGDLTPRPTALCDQRGRCRPVHGICPSPPVSLTRSDHSHPRGYRVQRHWLGETPAVFVTHLAHNECVGEFKANLDQVERHLAAAQELINEALTASP